MRWRVLNLNSDGLKDQSNVYKLPEEKNSIHSIEIFILIRFDLNMILLMMKVYEVKLGKGYLFPVLLTMKWNLF